MFRSKRHSLVKRLWKHRLINDETQSATETPEELELKSVAHTMLKRLKEKQLDILVQSVESKGGENTECVLLPKEHVRVGRRSFSHHNLCCRLWRWPDLSQEAELKRLSCCNTVNDPGYVCCNPYHWSLLLKPDTTVADQTRTHEQIERVKITDELLRVNESTETGMTPTTRRCTYSDSVNAMSGPHWCNIAYWEQRQRVGRLFTVFEPSISIFQVLPHGDGMCLEILQQDSNLESVRRTREKIGFGIILSQEGDGVWVYNRSLFPIFVNSPTLELPNSRMLVVRKVMPGYSIKMFDYEEAETLERTRDPLQYDGPYDPSSIRISFAKGWGPCYSRQFVTSCPCWVEILLNINR
ncbi:mothers against decapentaplegic homolog 6-like [Haliotis cracherodii]|uniref:mothers against decapentaplegic homolog 6-like n=1 Tax=Haliotis cracherodii TaxID=6455 RepID=UPI0039EB178D